MKKLLIIMALLLPLTVNAQRKGFKLVDKSNPKGKPSWVTEYRNGYFFEQAIEAATLNDAKDMVYTDLLADIAKSVASQIEVKIDHSAREVINVKGMTEMEYVETVKSEATLRVSRMPDLQGITLAKAEVYYERYYNKKTKEEYYNFYILYPFSKFEIDELIAKYNEQERLVNERIERNRNVAREFSKTDEIDAAIVDLDMLANELGKADYRISLIDDVKNILRSEYKKIYIEVVENVKNRITFNLVYDGRIIGSSAKPKLSSNCAEQFECRKSGMSYIVLFDSSYCYDEINFMKVTFSFKGIIINQNIYLK